MISRLFNITGDGTLTFYEFYLRQGAVWLVAVGVLAAAFFAAWLYRKEAMLRPGKRILLGTARALILGLLVVLLFEPVLGVEFDQKIRRNVLVLIDSSASMQIKDPRQRPGDVEEAALATGNAQDPNASAQAMLFKASWQMKRAAAAVAKEQLNDARIAQDRAIAAIQEAINFRKPKPDDKATDVVEKTDKPDPLSRLLERQQALRQTAEKDPKGRALAALGVDQQDLEKELSGILQAGRSTALAVDPATAAKLTEVPRMDLVKSLLSQSKVNVFAKLAEGQAAYDVRYFQFSDALQPTEGVAEAGAASILQTKPEGPLTRLGGAIQQAVTRYNGQPIAGVVVLTDGANNDGDDPLAVARAMGANHVPVFTVGIGIPQPSDVTVRSIVVQDVLFKKDRVPVRVQISSHGYDGAQASVVTRFYPDPATPREQAEIVAQESVKLTGGTQFVEMFFEPKEKADAARLEVTVEPQEGEISEANNTVSQTVKVIDEKIKVLYIEGKPRWEFRYLRAVLKRDRRLDVKFLMTEGDLDLAKGSSEYLATFPDDPEKAFAFDLVILGDVRGNYFRDNPAYLEKIEQLVSRHSGSFLMLAGHEHAPGEYVGTPIENLLPVKLKGGTNEKIESSLFPLVTVQGRQSHLMALEPTDEKNADRWALVKPMYDLPALDGAKQGATVLATLSDARRGEPYPLIAWQNYGSGKSMYVGTDQLWRLRFKTGDKYHARFWGQAIQFLTLSRLLGGNKRMHVQTDRLNASVGERVAVYVNAVNESYEPLIAKQFTVQIAGPEKTETKTLEATTTPGLFQGFITPDKPGRYTIRVPDADEKLANVVELEVRAIEKEQAETAMQQDLLKKMADLSGGEYFTLRDLPALPAVLEGESKTLVVRKEKELWDLWAVFFLVLGLAGFEWFVRRRSDLV